MKIIKTISIIAILTILVYVSAQIIIKLNEKVGTPRDVRQLEKLKHILAEYYSMYGYYPSNLTVLTTDTNKNMWIRYIEDMEGMDPLNDGRGHPVEYSVNDIGQAYILKSPGPDGKYETKDDLPPK